MGKKSLTSVQLARLERDKLFLAMWADEENYPSVAAIGRALDGMSRQQAHQIKARLVGKAKRGRARGDEVRH